MRKNIKGLILALIFTTTCWGQTTNAQIGLTLLSQTDSLNYTLGLLSGVVIKNECFKDKPFEECISEFMKYLDEGFTTNNQFVKPDTTNIYSEIIKIGNKVGSAFKAQLSTGFMNLSEFKIEFKLIKTGIEAGMRNDFSLMSVENSQNYLQKTLVEINLKNNIKENKRTKK